MMSCATKGHPPTRERIFEVLERDKGALATQPWINDQHRALENARPRDSIVWWHELEEIVGDAIWRAGWQNRNPDVEDSVTDKKIDTLLASAQEKLQQKCKAEEDKWNDELKDWKRKAEEEKRYEKLKFWKKKKEEPKRPAGPVCSSPKPMVTSLRDSPSARD
jgi:hypothetical protein